MRDRDPQVALVEQRLGSSTAKLYADVLTLFDVATRGATPTRAALRNIVINLLCGAYHDYKSEAALPKGDLVEALRAVPSDPPADPVIARIIGAALRGEYDEDDVEQRRWADRLLADNVRSAAVFKAKAPSTPAPVSLSAREGQVFAWLSRYIECYQRPPTTRELAEGLTMAGTLVNYVLGKLEAKGVVANVGGRRGWIPTRRP
jgi:hypothetical protein